MISALREQLAVNSAMRLSDMSTFLREEFDVEVTRFSVRRKTCSAKSGKLLGRRPNRCCSRCRHSDSPPDCPDRGTPRGVDVVKLNLPMRIDEALQPYSASLAAEVSNGDWPASYRAAGVVAMRKGYGLEWFCNNKAASMRWKSPNSLRLYNFDARF
jgi:hypothetical protein